MITRVHSATVTVTDQDAAVAFYTEKLGFQVRTDAPLGEEGGGRWIEVGPSDAQTVLGLMRPQDQAGATVSPGYTGVSLIVDDLQKTYDDLSAKGVEFTSPPQQMPWGSWATWLKDPEGNTFFITTD